MDKSGESSGEPSEDTGMALKAGCTSLMIFVPVLLFWNFLLPYKMLMEPVVFGAGMFLSWYLFRRSQAARTKTQHGVQPEPTSAQTIVKPTDDLDPRFTSDVYWNRFVKACEERWEPCLEKERVLASANGREDVAKALWASAHDSVFEWIDTPHPDISGQRPRELILSGTAEDTERLRAFLMQQPP